MSPYLENTPQATSEAVVDTSILTFNISCFISPLPLPLPLTGHLSPVLPLSIQCQSLCHSPLYRHSV